MMNHAAPAPRARVRRSKQYARYGWGEICDVLDATMICHVGLIVADIAEVVPTMFVRDNRRLLLHGSHLSRLLVQITSVADVVVSVAEIDGYVLARSIFEHSLNYRSVVLRGRACRLDDAEEKLAALRLFSEKTVPGRWDEVRPPSSRELKVTSIVAVEIVEATAKVREGPPADGSSRDVRPDRWAGVVPIVRGTGEPVPAAGVTAPLPPSVSALTR